MRYTASTLKMIDVGDENPAASNAPYTHTEEQHYKHDTAVLLQTRSDDALASIAELKTCNTC